MDSTLALTIIYDIFSNNRMEILLSTKWPEKADCQSSMLYTLLNASQTFLIKLVYKLITFCIKFEYGCLSFYYNNMFVKYLVFYTCDIKWMV